MKNICFLNGDMSRSGGTERVTAIIANELCKNEKEFKVHVISTVNNSNTSFFKLDKNIIQGKILEGENINFKKQYISVVKGIRKYIKENNIDILIDVDVITDLFSIPATRFTKTKLISWEHFNYYQDNGTRLRKIARKISGRYSDCIITLTEQDKENYKNNIKNKEKAKCIYNPIKKNDDFICDIKSKQIITVGCLRHIKGFDMLCDVAKEVLHHNEGWKWIILGEGEDRPLLENKIYDYGLEGKLILKGNVSNVEEYYKNSSLYVMTSRSEGLPMTLLEAKSYGLPIVSFDCKTGPSEIVRDNVNGFLIEPNNIEDMSNKIDILLSDRKQLKEFSDKSYLDIDKFELNTIVNQWGKTLKNL